MKHKMNLSSAAFDLMNSGRKKIEVRLYDEKRRQLNIGDEIEFTRLPDMQNSLNVRITELLKYKSFTQLYADFPSEDFGGDDMEELLEKIYLYYTKEQEDKYGVLGIKITLA